MNNIYNVQPKCKDTAVTELVVAHVPAQVAAPEPAHEIPWTRLLRRLNPSQSRTQLLQISLSVENQAACLL